MSRVEYNIAASQSLKIYVQTPKTQNFKIEYSCRLDSTELSDDACLSAFNIQLNGVASPRDFNGKKGDAFTFSASLREPSKITNFAFLTPEISPARDPNQPKPKSGVEFIIQYKPGLLFRTTNDQLTLPVPIYELSLNDKGKPTLSLNYNVKNLAYPVHKNLSVQILDKKTKKIVSFGRVAIDKILDPDRKEIAFKTHLRLPVDRQDAMESLCPTIIEQNANNPSDVRTTSLCEN